LTTPLAEFLLSLPEQYLLSEAGETKHVFRAAMRGLVPDAILDRKDKIGFATPEKAWLVKLGPTIHRWIADAPRLPFIREELLQAEFERVLAGKQQFSQKLWRFINFCRWLQIRNVRI
jgi:asparagine synthase (glutamine-hydrolysing)